MKRILLSLFLALLMHNPTILFAQTADTSASAVITSTGWYRIAVNGPMVANGTGGNRAAARFILRDATSSYHQSTEFMASVQYGNQPGIVVLNSSYHHISVPIFYKIRIVEGSTYDGAAIEVYVIAPSTGATAYIKDNVQISGWNLVPWTKVTGLTGDQDGVPAGFTASVINLASLRTGFVTDKGTVSQFNNGRININDPTATTGSLNIRSTGAHEMAFTGSESANIYSEGELYFFPVMGKSLHFGSNGINDRMVLDVNGNFGIGTTDTKGYKLAVNGNAIFTKVKVKPFTGWPDYVFDDNYPLTNLKALGEFVKSKKHLPGIPSAGEIANSGQDLGEMNMLLLKKIEELTLYLLDHHKKIELLQEQVKSLEKENKALQQSSSN